MMFVTVQLVTARESAQAPVPTTNGGGTISGNALTPSKGQVSRRRVQLRDAQSGRVILTGSTNQTGFFSFANVQPGNYIVELLGANQSVLAASSVLTLQAGDALTAVLTVPVAAAAAAGALASTATMAGIVAAGAAAAGVLAVKAAGDPTCPQ